MSALRRALAEDPVRAYDGPSWRDADGVDPRRLPGPVGLPSEAIRRAHRLATQGELDLAMEDFRALLRDAPDDAYAWLGLGASALVFGELKQARQALHAYLRLVPDDPAGWANLAEVELRRDALGAAAAALDRAREGRAPQPEIQRRVDALGRALARRQA